MNKKQFFDISDMLKEKEWWGFNWLEHLTAVPAPLVLVTGYKENGLANGTMQSWFCFSSENDFYCIFGSVSKYSHMYEIATEKKQLAVNFPDKTCIEKCMNTIANNSYDLDELTASGLHYHNGSKIKAPIVDECFLNLECEVVWEKEISEGGIHVALCVKIVNVWMDEAHYNAGKCGRYGETGYLYNVHSPVNPETGQKDASTLGILNILPS